MICPDSQGKPRLCGVASYKQCDKGKMCRRPSYFTRVDKFLDWIEEKTGGAMQEQDKLFDEPMVPAKIKDKDVPGWLVRISGANVNCMGTVIGPTKVITTSNCIMRNLVDGKYLIFNIYHYKSQRGYSHDDNDNWSREPDISANITKYLQRPLGKLDVFVLKLKEPIQNYETLKVPPRGYKIKGVAEEYSMNQKISAVQKRRYLEMNGEECQQKLNKIDSNVRLDMSHLCMQRAYGAEADTDCSKDLGGPLVCEGKYFCGFKTFQACGPLLSSFPEIFNNNMTPNMEKILKAK